LSAQTSERIAGKEASASDLVGEIVQLHAYRLGRFAAMADTEKLALVM
jgi:hypothetical protein